MEGRKGGGMEERREFNSLLYLLILPKERHGGGQMGGAFVRYSSRN